MDLVNRLKFFLEKRNIAISQFADTCKIPRPTLSQILNGRNKKISDELITKIHNAYPSLSVLWLMFGEGDMETNANIEISDGQNGLISPGKDDYSSESQYNPLTFGKENPNIISDSEKFDSPNSGYSSDFSPENAAAKAYPTETDENRGQAQPINFYNNVPNRSYQHVTPRLADLHDESGTATSDQLNFPSDQLNFNSPSQPDASPELNFDSPTEIRNENEESDRPHPTTVPLGGGASISIDSPSSKKIKSIVVFYTDNSFQSFEPASL